MILSCPICGKPLQGRQTVCSAKCRVARSRQRREARQHERDSQVRLLLTTAIEAATEAKALLKPEKEPAL
jgi:predicted nucleic acid-binding Zn ribbon protein